MNSDSNCCATSRSASVTPWVRSAGSGCLPLPTVLTLRLSRCRESKSNTDTRSDVPGRGVYCVNDMAASDDLDVGAQGTGALQVLKNGQQILRRRAQRVKRTHDFRKIGACADALQAALVGAHLDIGGWRDHGLAAPKRSIGLIHVEPTADHDRKIAISDGGFVDGHGTVHHHSAGTRIDDQDRKRVG